ncbi:hypothetical protein B0684_12885 [Thioalkalivibrio versutus]|nr:hypothetical protein B0684_12885 [Thioalkalivibrio versutus]
MEQLAYRVKQRFPGVFRWIEAGARGVTVLRYGRQIRRARADAAVQGTVRGEAAVMRPLGLDDLDALHRFLANQPEEQLRYFCSHGFDRAVLGTGRS